MMQFIKVEKHGIEAEIPKKVAVSIQQMDDSLFSKVYKDRSNFFKQMLGKDQMENSPELIHFKNNLNRFFRIEKRRRGLMYLEEDDDFESLEELRQVIPEN